MGEGRVQLFIIPDANVRVMTVAVNDRIAAIHFLDGVDDALNKDFVNYSPNTEQMRAGKKITDELLSSALEEAGTGEFLTAILDRCSADIEAFFVDSALMLTDHDQRAGAAETLGNRGRATIWRTSWPAARKPPKHPGFRSCLPPTI